MALLDEIFNGGAVDSSNQSFALLLMGVSSSENISSLKLGRVTEQSIAMMRHLKLFFNVQFKIAECEDDVYSDSEDEEEEEEKDAGRESEVSGSE